MVSDKAPIGIDIVPFPTALLAVCYPHIYCILKKCLLAQLFESHVLKVCPAHFASTAGARSALESVAAGYTDIVDSSTCTQHAAKSTSTATHPHTGHHTPAHVI